MNNLFIMRITMDLFIAFCCLIFVRLVNAKHTFPKTKMNKTDLRDGAMPNMLQSNQLLAYPQPLPKVAKIIEVSPYTKLYQGVRNKDDTRVFRKRFEYEPMLTGQQIVCQGLFDCVISHLAIESTEAIPVLLRGGAGYRHFTAVVKSKPNKELKGQVRAYCRNNYVPLAGQEPRKSEAPKRRFYFGDLINEEDSS